MRLACPLDKNLMCSAPAATTGASSSSGDAIASRPPVQPLPVSSLAAPSPGWLLPLSSLCARDTLRSPPSPRPPAAPGRARLPGGTALISKPPGKEASSHIAALTAASSTRLHMRWRRGRLPLPAPPRPGWSFCCCLVGGSEQRKKSQGAWPALGREEGGTRHESRPAPRRPIARKAARSKPQRPLVTVISLKSRRTPTPHPCGTHAHSRSRPGLLARAVKLPLAYIGLISHPVEDLLGRLALDCCANELRVVGYEGAGRPWRLLSGRRLAPGPHGKVHE